MEKPVNGFSNAIKTDHIELTYPLISWGNLWAPPFIGASGRPNPVTSIQPM